MVSILRITGNESKGFSLIEVMMAVLVIMVLSTAFVPLFVFVAESAQGNRAKLVATALAKSVIEDARSREYLYEVGLAGGNPGGEFEPIITYQKIDGIEYTIETQIGWVDDPADGTYPVDKMPFDYKWIRVTVSAHSAFRGEVIEFADFDTLVAREGGDEAFSGIRAHAYRGWNTNTINPEEKEPVANARVDILSGPGSPITDWTDVIGRVLFNLILGQGIESADYTVQLTPPTGSGFIVHPDHVGVKTVEVPKGLTVDHLIFELEKPCIVIVDFDPQLTSGGGKIILQSPIGQKEVSFDHEDVPVAISDVWPLGEGYAGSYSIKVEGLEGFNDYNMDIHDPPYLSGNVNETWQGVFAAPDTTVSITVPLSKTFYTEPPFVAKTKTSEGVTVSDDDVILIEYNVHSERSSANWQLTGGSYSWIEQRLEVKETVLLTAVDLATWINGNHTLKIYDASDAELLSAEAQGARNDWFTFSLDEPLVLSPGVEYRFRFEFPSSGKFIYSSPWILYNGTLWKANQLYASGNNNWAITCPMGLVTAGGYQATGYRISDPIDLSNINMGELPDLRIYWEAIEPENTSIEIRTAITTDTTPPDESDYSEPLAKGDIIPGLPESPEGYLWIKQILTTSDTSSTPVLEKLVVIY